MIKAPACLRVQVPKTWLQAVCKKPRRHARPEVLHDTVRRSSERLCTT
jgi:hypothetical protein